MLYKVKARLIEGKGKEFYELVTSKELKKQRPDGREIIASMKRATIDETGLVRWTEMCFCPTPLMHERATVYDRYFIDMGTEDTDKHEVFEGKSFVEYLSSK